MPIFLDLHIGQGLTAEDIAMAHQLDMEIQDDYRCKCLTYWADEERGNAYCLVEAPDKHAVYELHKNSHKQLPDEIVEVDRRVVKAFLGRIHDPEFADYMIDQKIKVFNDPAFRVILVIEFTDERLLTHKLEKKESTELVQHFTTNIHELIKKHSGVPAEMAGQELVASFEGGYNATACAIDIKESLKIFKKVDLQICAHAGIPVDKSEEIFGTTLQLARFLIGSTQENQIIITSTVKQLLKDVDLREFSTVENLRYISSEDQEFLIQLVEVIQNNWQRTTFGTKDFCKAMSASKSHLYRKCTEIIGMSPKRILHEFRLKKAKKMLKSNLLNVTQTAFDAGFSSPSYFTKCFYKRFGVQPTVYLKT